MPGQHFQIAGAEQTASASQIRYALKRYRNPILIHAAARRNGVLSIERYEVETLTKNEDTCGKIAASAWDAKRRVVTACTGIGIWG
ncbi:MAG: hypothetical protein WBW33_00850 [Bryobacteraceae bacterium]